LYSGQDFNGNRRGTIGPIYGPEYRLFGSATTIVNPNDLRSMNVPDGLTVKLYTERNYTGDMGTYTGAWSGRVNQWDNAESMIWSFTNGVPVQVVASSGQFCPLGSGTLIGSGSTAYCQGRYGNTKPEIRCPLGFGSDPLKTWCVRF
jgi:2-keto-4-pentenoate hydratase/2-oxohepta-3-ene-1,7-dioic acid hydratase in catechol pathway